MKLNKILILSILFTSCIICTEKVESAIVEHLVTSQIGYKPNDKKIGVLGLDAQAGSTTFQVTTIGNSVVLEKVIVYWGERWGKKFYLLDFSSFSVPGQYKLKSNGLESDPFYIKESIWQNQIDVNEFFSSFFVFQRCDEHLVTENRSNKNG